MFSYFDSKVMQTGKKKRPFDLPSANLLLAKIICTFSNKVDKTIH